MVLALTLTGEPDNRNFTSYLPSFGKSITQALERWHAQLSLLCREGDVLSYLLPYRNNFIVLRNFV